ncbi:hypothetical protein V8E53_003887, partial [Lactarius tabidus]
KAPRVQVTYDRIKSPHALFAADLKYEKQKEYTEDESDLDEDAVAEHEEQCKAREIERTKKFAMENEKRSSWRRASLPRAMMTYVARGYALLRASLRGSARNEQGGTQA